MNNIYFRFTLPCLIMLVCDVSLCASAKEASSTTAPVKVFILAGDENVLGEGIVKGRTDGVHQDFFPHPAPAKNERRKHVNVSVYFGTYSPETDYDRETPLATGLVELGDARTRRANPKKRGREPIPMTPFPEPAFKDGHTTVLRGYLSVEHAGRYEFHPGKDETAFNLTTLEGKEVYLRTPDEPAPRITPVELAPNRRYAFQTIFFGRPGHAFRLPLVNKPGTLETVVDENPKYNYLKGAEGNWAERRDVVLYDAHPDLNNTKAPGRPLQVGAKGGGGPETATMIGPALSLGHGLGNAFEEPVLIIRYGTWHPIWFRRGSRSLGHDFRPPSSGGGADHDGGWDVIHFNHGVHDTAYRNPANYKAKDENKFPICIPIDEYEKNLRTIVARLKKTGATLIWARITPVQDDTPGWKAVDIDRYNAVADRVMKENGVIINDLHAVSLRQGFPKRPDVHSVGNLAPKVTETILAALAQRENSTEPLPRVLMVGDSITGSYWEKVKSNLDGKAYVCKNPANAGHSRFGAESIDAWVELKRYLLNGESYLELLEGVRIALKDPAQVYLGYQGQGVELGGLIWFQGLADGASPAMAKNYETNLANLIRDLRRDFDAPRLPVVVTALANCTGQMTPNQQNVFDAQMAVGDKEKYPEFADSVARVDTRPMCRPADLSPGGRDRYKGNAESYLEIGEAMAEAMLQMIETAER